MKKLYPPGMGKMLTSAGLYGKTENRRKTMAAYEIRVMTPEEYPLLEDFLYLAIHIPPGQEPPPREVLDSPVLQVYIRGFGQGKTDRAMVAEIDGKPVGAAWARIMGDYGHVDNATPSLAVAVAEPYRGQGIGGELLRALLGALKQAGYRRASLSVQKENPAVSLYKRLGFQILRESGAEYIMIKALTD